MLCCRGAERTPRDALTASFGQFTLHSLMNLDKIPIEDIVKTFSLWMIPSTRPRVPSIEPHSVLSPSI